MALGILEREQEAGPAVLELGFRPTLHKQTAAHAKHKVISVAKSEHQTGQKGKGSKL